MPRLPNSNRLSDFGVLLHIHFFCRQPRGRYALLILKYRRSYSNIEKIHHRSCDALLMTQGKVILKIYELYRLVQKLLFFIGSFI